MKKKNRIIIELDDELKARLNEKSKELKISKKVILILALNKFLDDIEQFGVEI